MNEKQSAAPETPDVSTATLTAGILSPVSELRICAAITNPSPSARILPICGGKGIFCAVLSATFRITV